MRTHGADKTDEISLGAVPACIPGGFNKTETEIIRKFLTHATGYRRIFGPTGKEQPLIEQVDSILTSVGTTTISSQFADLWLDETVSGVNIKKQELARFTVGNIGGVFLHRQELSISDRRLIDDINT